MKKYVLLTQALLVKVLSRPLPGVAGRIVGNFWFKTNPMKPHPERESWIEQAETKHIDHRGKTIRAHRRRPEGLAKGCVVVVHGWSGRWDQLMPIAKELLNSQFEVVTFDWPAHGENKGDNTDFFEVSELIQSVVRSFELDSPSFVCHSAGFLPLAHAKLKRGVKVSKLVTINCPAHARFLFDLLIHQLKLPKSFDQQIWKVIERRVKARDVQAQFSTEALAQIPPERVLVIHDQNDKEVHFREMEKIKAIWGTPKTLVTQGLGHNRILANEPVIKQITSFL